MLDVDVLRSMMDDIQQEMEQQPKMLKCFVPNCNKNAEGVVGVLFPKNEEKKKTWLQILGLEHLEPNSKSFICLDHFDKDGQPTRSNPSISKSPTPDEKTNVEEVFLNNSSVNIKKIPAKVPTKTPWKKTPLRGKGKTCRLCMIQSTNVTDRVFDKLDDQHTVAEIINICLNPIQIDPNDALSKHICKTCNEKVRTFYKFYQNCLKMDVKQRMAGVKRDYYNSDESLQSDEYLFEERLSDFEDDKENKGETKYLSANGYSTRNSFLTTEKDNKSFGNEELLKVLEGDDYKEKLIDSKSTDLKKPKLAASKDDTEYVEDIIIEMVNDDTNNLEASSLIDTTKLPITITRVNPGEKRKFNSQSTDFDSVSVTKRSRTLINTSGNKTIIFPQPVKLQQSKTFAATTGKVKAELIKYILNSKFLLAAGYLYKFGITKHNVRKLHCVLERCPSFGHQIKTGENEYLREIDIIVPHIHMPLDSPERRRQMFYDVLKSKMDSSKMNFKILYEEFCKLDPNIKKILPINNVVKEMCRQESSAHLYFPKSFEEFYNYIEDYKYHKIHFTNNGVQFYQSKFQSTDGGRAVIFANRNSINKYSDSQLMFVDATFYIECVQFPYQLVTVLVWIDNSYYPIIFALVNLKSQELYKKIFSYVFKTLAPKLKPAEIITDYEANLYYALGETYVDSSIGGSIFYFTQNIYKKICSLNLAKELEQNSNFRSIYDMILMLPLLPVNTILDGLNNIKAQAKELNLEALTQDLFTYVYSEWIYKVTPELFCVHRLENRINENIVAPFKKLRDFIMLSKTKTSKGQASLSVITTIEKLLELEKFSRVTYNNPQKKHLTKDVSSTYKKIILNAWNYIENHPMINIYQFFLKVLGYIKCMENQLWIWGFYRFPGKFNETLIDSSNFHIVNEENPETGSEIQKAKNLDNNKEKSTTENDEDSGQVELIEEYYIEDGGKITKVKTRQICSNVEASMDDPAVLERELFLE